MPEESKKEEGLETKHPKKGGKLDKYKWYIVGGLAVVAILVFYFVNRSNSQAQQSTAGGQGSGIDPNTGLPYASEYGNFPGGGFGGGGGIGPAGPPGPPGPPGKGGGGRHHHKRDRDPHKHDRDRHDRDRHHHRHMRHANPVNATIGAGARTEAFSNSVLTHPGTFR